MSQKSDKAIESMVLEFLDTASGLERRFDRALSIRGISFSEYKLLRALSEAGARGKPRAALAEHVALTPSAVTRALKPLEKLGYVETAKNSRDARQSLAIITKAGDKLQQDAALIVRDVLAGLSISKANQEQTDEFALRLADIRSIRS